MTAANTPLASETNANLSPTDTPLTPEAEALVRALIPRIRQRMEEAARVPVAVLVWGPGINSSGSLARVRAELRAKLRQNGHAALYSEELYDPQKSLRLQELAQAQEFDLVISLPGTPGSLAEVHDFASDRRVSNKLMAFLNQQHISGYSAQSISALSGTFAVKVFYYPNENDTSIIFTISLSEAQRLREIKYLTNGRQ
jgi:hypothetical protein